jgi:hypothetical protein
VLQLLDTSISLKKLRFGKGWHSMAECLSRCAKGRVTFCETCLALKLKPEDWHDIRFSDEVHCRIGRQGKMRITGKPGEKYCGDCIQEQLNKGDEKEWETCHIWGAVGYNFKRDLTFYKTPGNKNGKLSLSVYRDQILEAVIKPWLKETEPHFILEEDNDSGHGGGSASNIVATWKKKNKLDHYFNHPSSPDLAPIENCWQVMKQHLKKYPHWDQFEVRDLAREGWSHASSEFINERINSFPQRLQDCIEIEGRMTGY